MKNHEQQHTLSDAITTVNNLDLSSIDKCTLNNILNCYHWLSEHFGIDATYRDIVSRFLDEKNLPNDIDISPEKTALIINVKGVDCETGEKNFASFYTEKYNLPDALNKVKYAIRSSMQFPEWSNSDIKILHYGRLTEEDILDQEDLWEVGLINLDRY